MVYRDIVVILPALKLEEKNQVCETWKRIHSLRSLQKKFSPNFEKETENIVKKGKKIFTPLPIFIYPCLRFHLTSAEIPKNSNKFPLQNEFDFQPF